MAIHTCLVIYIYLVTCVCLTKFSGVGFCPTKFKLCLTKIKIDRTNVLSSQIPEPQVFFFTPNIDVGTLLQIAQQKNTKTMKKIFKKKFISDLPTLIFSRYETGTTGIFFMPDV